MTARLLPCRLGEPTSPFPKTRMTPASPKVYVPPRMLLHMQRIPFHSTKCTRACRSGVL
jgi:hypothetical protein